MNESSSYLLLGSGIIRIGPQYGIAAKRDQNETILRMTPEKRPRVTAGVAR